MNENIWDTLDYEKNAVIEASAGTGKTYTLEHIVKKLVVEKGYDIRSILLVTFTEKAAGELKERIRDMLKDCEEARKLLPEATICTIHAFCREVLSDYPFESGMSMGMEIGGSDEALFGKAVHAVLTSKEFQEDCGGTFADDMINWKADGDADKVAEVAVKALGGIVSVGNFDEWKADKEKCQREAERGNQVFEEKIILQIVSRAYPEFLRLKARTSSVTFDDLIRETARLVAAATGPNAPKGPRRFVERMRSQYRLALVDEFQDTDAKQWQIFKNLFADVGHLIVVGDPKQAIYGWRGADLATYLKATQEIVDGGGQFKRLETMYRSTKEMVKDFNTMFMSGWFERMNEDGRTIQYSEVKFPNANIPEKVKDFVYPEGERAVEWLESTAGLKQFAANAANEMIRLHEAWGERMAWNEMCVLVRSRADGRMVQAHLAAKRIPCRIYKESGIFASIEAESIVALFDYLSLPGNLGNLSALLLTPLFGYTPETLDARLANGDAAFDRLCADWRTAAERRDWLALFESVLMNTGARSAISGYRQIFDHLLENNGKACSLAELSEVLRGLKCGEQHAGENGNVRNKSSEDAAVQIMTMHASKGLEFNAVFVAGGFAGRSTAAEMKRLFYVALTRACFKLYLPWSEGFEQGVVKRGSALGGYLGVAIRAVCGNDVRGRFRDPGNRELPEPQANIEEARSDGCPTHLGMKRWRFRWDSFSSLNHPVSHRAITVEGVEGTMDEALAEAQVQPKTLVPKGALSGTVFHEVMDVLCRNRGEGEEIGFEIGQKDDFDALVSEQDGKRSPLLEIVRRRLAANGVANRVREDGSDSTARSLARMVWNALRTPLDFGAGEFRLCEIKLEDRKSEVGFVLDEELLLKVDQAREGALNGSIDLLFRHGGNYYIVDWKTNALSAYDRESVSAAMDCAGYHLQYQIYAMAAEKWLGAAVKGAAYLFVRGGEYGEDRSGLFLHAITDEERAQFVPTLAERVGANDKAEDEEVA